MIEYSARLQAAMTKRGVTVSQVAAGMGVSYQAVKRVLDGLSKAFSAANNTRAASFLNVRADWLATGEGEMEIPTFDANAKPSPSGARPYPVVSRIQAGRLSEMTIPYGPNDGYDIEYGDDDASTGAFFLEVEGDSMQPQFNEGDRVMIDPEVIPRPGDFVAARNSKEEATFKKYRVRGIDARGCEVFELVPLNENYPSMRSDEHTLHIIGTMVEHRRKFRRKH